MVFLYPRLDYGIVVMIPVLAALSLFCLKTASELPPRGSAWAGEWYTDAVHYAGARIFRRCISTCWSSALAGDPGMVVRLEQRWLRRGILVVMGLLCFTGCRADCYTRGGSGIIGTRGTSGTLWRAYVQPGTTSSRTTSFTLNCATTSGGMEGDVLPGDSARRGGAGQCGLGERSRVRPTW